MVQAERHTPLVSIFIASRMRWCFADTARREGVSLPIRFDAFTKDSAQLPSAAAIAPEGYIKVVHQSEEFNSVLQESEASSNQAASMPETNDVHQATSRHAELDQESKASPSQSTSMSEPCIRVMYQPRRPAASLTESEASSRPALAVQQRYSKGYPRSRYTAFISQGQSVSSSDPAALETRSESYRSRRYAAFIQEAEASYSDAVTVSETYSKGVARPRRHVPLTQETETLSSKANITCESHHAVALPEPFTKDENLSDSHAQLVEETESLPCQASADAKFYTDAATDMVTSRCSILFSARTALCIL